jgi:Tol biopolymer transport system component
VALGAFGLYRFTSAGTGASSLISFNVPIPGGGGPEAMFALSPDGQNLAIASPEKGQIHLWVRPLDGLEARLLPGGEGARYPFWSPDGKQIGFFADGKLKKVSLAGGEPTVVVADVGVGVNGGTWGSHGIVFAIDRDLYKVEETGGNPVPLAHATSGFFANPEFLPDGRHFLYVQHTNGGIEVGSLDGAAPRQILPDLSRAVYADGNLLFRRQGRLMAQPFDTATLTASGAAVPITKETVINSGSMGSTVLFSVAGSRALAYQAQALEQLVWVDRTGTMKEKVGPPNEWNNFRLSPDENKIAMDITIFQAGNSARDVALFDLVRGTQDRLTSDPEADLVPIFSPRGDRIVFTSRRMGRFNPFITSAPNQEKLVVDLGMLNGFPMDWSPDEKHILWWKDGDLWIVPVSGNEKPYAYVHTRFDERDGVFSPDGRWITYVSNESGRDELYLESFPADAGKRYTVSSQGGTGPAWRRDGKELFFVAGDGRLTAVPVTMKGADIQLGRAESLFPMKPGAFHRAYDVSKDGQRFLIATPAQAGGAVITVVLNWQAALKQ